MVGIGEMAGVGQTAAGIVRQFARGDSAQLSPLSTCPLFNGATEQLS